MTDNPSCPRCRSPLRPSARFCSNCGTVVATPTGAPPQHWARPEVTTPKRHAIARPLLITGGCLLTGGLVLVVLLLGALSMLGDSIPQRDPTPFDPAPARPTLARRDPSSQPPDAGADAPLVRPTRVHRLPTTPPVVAPTEAPVEEATPVIEEPGPVVEVPTVVPQEVVGNWAIVNTLGTLGYTFHPDGRFKRAILSQTSDGSCTSTYEEVEIGTATFDNGVMTLTITAGEQHVYDTCGRDERTPVEVRVEQYSWYRNGEALNIDNTDYKRYE